MDIQRINDDYNGNVLNGQTVIFGTDHHVRMVRVKEGPFDDIEPLDDAPDEVKGMFEDMQGVYEGAYHTIEIPGREGRYVLFIFPFAD